MLTYWDTEDLSYFSIAACQDRTADPPPPTPPPLSVTVLSYSVDLLGYRRPLPDTSVWRPVGTVLPTPPPPPCPHSVTVLGYSVDLPGYRRPLTDTSVWRPAGTGLPTSPPPPLSVTVLDYSVDLPGYRRPLPGTSVWWPAETGSAFSPLGGSLHSYCIPSAPGTQSSPQLSASLYGLLYPLLNSPICNSFSLINASVPYSE